MTAKTFILVHGAWHNSSCWRKLSPLLTALGHNVLAPDLPGHGVNIVPNNKISLNLYAKHISQLIDKYEDVVLVGHSMGGMVISQVAELKPDRISALIYLAAFLPQDGQSVFALMTQNRGQALPTKVEKHMVLSADKRACTIASEVIASLFYSQCTPADIKQALRDFSTQATLSLSGKVKLTQDNFGKLKKTYICCRNDEVIPFAHQQEMLARQPCEQVLQIDSGHSPFFSTPEVLAKLLDKI